MLALGSDYETEIGLAIIAFLIVYGYYVHANDLPPNNVPVSMLVLSAPWHQRAGVA